MAGIGESVVEEVKARTDLAELIESYGVTVRRAGATLKACCPFHNEKTPSFNINASRGFYHCFGCGESGDAITFVQKQEGLSFAEAVKKLAQRCGVKVEETYDPEAGRRKRLYALMTELAQFYHRCLLKTREARLAREYLAKRELDEKAWEDWTIGYAPNGVATILTWAEKYGFTPAELEEAGVIKAPNRPGDAGYHRFGGRLMFTIRDRQGRVVAFSGRQLVERKNAGKYVNSPETPIFRKSNVLFGFDRAAAAIVKAPNREAIACEGQIDTIRLHLNGYANAVASQGTAFTEEHARMLKRVADSMVLVYDDDAAGHKATVKVAGLMLALDVPVRVVRLPDGEDPDSFLRKHGAAAFQALVDAAESVVRFQCRSERAKERDPKSIDAVARVTRAVLGTIACAASPVLRASMVGEAAEILGLPAEALREELAKTAAAKGAPHVPPPPRGEPDGDGGADGAFEDVDGCPEDEADSAEPIPGEDAAAVAPPPAREMALLEFLLANERNATLDGMLGEFLPPDVFAHDFTRRFVAAWRQEAVAAEGAEDGFAAFGAALAPRERAWFEKLLLAGGKTDASSLAATDILQDFIRGLWGDALQRARGALPASGDAAADIRRMQISRDLKDLRMARWHDVKDLIRNRIMKGEYSNGPQGSN